MCDSFDIPSVRLKNPIRPLFYCFSFSRRLGDAHSELSTFLISPFSSNLHNSLSIISNDENGTFLFGLNTGFTLSLSSNFTSVFVQ